MTGYTLASGVAWVQVESGAGPAASEPRAVAARVPDGPPMALHGSSAVIWLCALQGGDAQDVVAAVVEATGGDHALVAGPVTDFLDELVARGLLTHD